MNEKLHTHHDFNPSEYLKRIKKEKNIINKIICHFNEKKRHYTQSFPTVLKADFTTYLHGSMGRAGTFHTDTYKKTAFMYDFAPNYNIDTNNTWAILHSLEMLYKTVIYLGDDKDCEEHQELSQKFRRGTVRTNSKLWESDIEFPIVLGAQYWQEEMAGTHVLIMGQTGGGKSTHFDMLMKSAFKNFEEDCKKRRAFVFDEKNEYLRKLERYGMLDRVILFNPDDSRSSYWQIWKDVRTKRESDEFASILVPSNDVSKSDQSFFDSASKRVIWCIINAFIDKGIEWTFKDLVNACLDLDAAKALLSGSWVSEKVYKAFFEEQKLGSHLHASFVEKISKFIPLAMSLEASRRREPLTNAVGMRTSEGFSIREWLNSGDILVFGYSDRCESAMRGVFSMFSTLIAQEGLQKENNQESTWLFLDELLEGGRLAGLPKILNKGRSKGFKVVMTLPGVPEFFSRTYYEEQGKTMLSNVSNLLVCHMGCTISVEWAANRFGKAEYFETITDESEQKSNSSSSGQSDNSSKSFSDSNNTGTSENRPNREGLFQGNHHGSKGNSSGSGKSSSVSSSSSQTHSKGTSESNSETKKGSVSERFIVTPSEILAIRKPSEHGINASCFYQTSHSKGVGFASISHEYVTLELEEIAKSKVKNFSPARDFHFEDEKRLLAWTDAELERLGLKDSDRKPEESTKKPTAAPSGVSNDAELETDSFYFEN